MALEKLFPNGDDGGWPTGSYLDIDEGTDSPNDTDVMSSDPNGEGDILRLDFDNTGVADADTVSNVDIKVRVKSSIGTASSIFVDLRINGVTQNSVELSTTTAFQTLLFNDANWNQDWTQAELDSLQIVLTPAQSGKPTNEQWDISAVQAEITYTAAAGDRVETITVGAMNWAGQSFKKNMAVIPAAGNINWAGQSFKKNMAVIPAAGNINWAGQPFKVLSAVVNIITAGVINWTGQNFTVNARSSRDIVVGALNWTAQTLRVNRSRIIASGVMNWLGQNLVAFQPGGTVPNINDAKLSKLEAELAKSGHVSDLEVEWLQSLDVSVTSDDVDTAWHQYWDFLGIPAGARNGRAYAWLGGLGYTGSLNNRWLSFWQSP